MDCLCCFLRYSCNSTLFLRASSAVSPCFSVFARLASLCPGKFLLAFLVNFNINGAVACPEDDEEGCAKAADGVGPNGTEEKGD